MDKSRIAVNTYNNIAKIYKDKYFSDLSDTPYIDKFLQFIPKNGKILDIGCGCGNFSAYIQDKGFEITGIDLSEEMLKIAKENVPEVKFMLMDMRKLAFNPSTFDGLLVAYSLIHIPSDEVVKTLRGFHEVLKPDGYMLICAQKGDANHVVEEPLMKGKKMFINFFTKGRLSKYLTESGFQVSSQEEVDIQDLNSMSDKVIYTISRKS